MRQWLEEERRKAELDNLPKAPPMTVRYLLAEAAAYFHTDGIDGLMRKPVERRAEMMAHVLLRDAREGFIEHQREVRNKQRQKSKSGYNPAEAQRKKWRIG